ncbi:MAG: molybdenum cofactor guanylyltransferase [Mycobacterium sp.]
MSFPLAGVVLAGGASRRMGRDKATIPYQGPDGPTTFVEHLVSLVQQRCDRVYVVAAPGQPVPDLKADLLRDEVLGVGPLLATGRGLRAAASDGFDWAFVCAVDLPYLTTDIIDTLTAHAEHPGAASVVLPWDGRNHYLAALYRTSLADTVDALVANGERSMRALIDTVDSQQLVLTEPQRALTNVNTAADLL